MKSPVPETRNSLILRLPDKRDVDAWDQFASIFEPLVYRLARAQGFQDADAQEIVQEVLVAVSRAVERWEPDPARGRFRDWLFRIARNLMINFLTRRKHLPIGSGDSKIAELLENHIDPRCEESATFDLHYRREVFRWAAKQVRDQVKERTWSAFWMTSVDGHAIAEVASDLGMSVGAVHVARSRALGRLREPPHQFNALTGRGLMSFLVKGSSFRSSSNFFQDLVSSWGQGQRLFFTCWSKKSAIVERVCLLFKVGPP